MSVANGATMIDGTGQAFDRHAHAYGERWGGDPVAALMRAEVHRAMATSIREPSRVLDLGCGIGLDSEWLKLRSSV